MGAIEAMEDAGEAAGNRLRRFEASGLTTRTAYPEIRLAWSTSSPMSAAEVGGFSGSLLTRLSYPCGHRGSETSL